PRIDCGTVVGGVLEPAHQAKRGDERQRVHRANRQGKMRVASIREASTPAWDTTVWVGMIVRETRLYRLAELFFDEEGVPDDVDVIEYFQWSEPVPRTRYSDFYTLHLDLTQ